MFSRRTNWPEQPNRLAQAIEAARAADTPLLDLTISNPTTSGFDYPADRILTALATSSLLRYDPDPRGLASARQAVARDLATPEDAVDPEWLLLTASTSEAYAWLLKLLCNDGDEILAPMPSYPLFDFLTDLEDVALTHYPLRYEGGWEIDFDELEARIGERTRALLVVHPNNPTGHFVSVDSRRRLLELCAERGLALVSDEVFLDFPFEAVGAPASLAAGESPALTFALGGLSKTAGLPQLKLAWMRLAGPLGLREEARRRLEVIADTYLSVNTPVQQAAASLLDARRPLRDQIRERVRRNRALLVQELARAPSVDLLASDAGWSAVLRVPATHGEEEWCLRALRECQVLVHPGYFFDFPHGTHLVLSLLPPLETFRSGVSRLIELLGSQG